MNRKLWKVKMPVDVYSFFVPHYSLQNPPQLVGFMALFPVHCYGSCPNALLWTRALFFQVWQGEDAWGTISVTLLVSVDSCNFGRCMSGGKLDKKLISQPHRLLSPILRNCCEFSSTEISFFSLSHSAWYWSRSTLVLYIGRICCTFELLISNDFFIGQIISFKTFRVKFCRKYNYLILGNLAFLG